MRKKNLANTIFYMGILQNNPHKKDEKAIDLTLAKTKNLLLIFTRNPVLGKGKRRLAKTVGDQAALDIYNFLLKHTVAITTPLYAHKQVYYSEDICTTDMWDNSTYSKKKQVGNNLGDRMAHAFLEGFKDHYEKIIIIGSDMYDLSTEDLENAFKALDNHDFVIGPAEDGGYYLLGMKTFTASLFKNKDWGTATVLEATLQDLENENFTRLAIKNDIDYYEDIKESKAFEPFLKHLKK